MPLDHSTRPAHPRRFASGATHSIRAAVVSLCATAALIAGCASPPPSVQVTRSSTPETTIVIQNVTVVDTANLTTVPAMDVTIESNIITNVSPTGEAPTPTGATLISGEGASLVPGLIDMHGHVSSATAPTWEFASPDPEGNLLAFVYSGVTTVFDPSDSSGDAFTRRDAVAAGELIGPRIYTTGQILTCEHGHPRSLIEALAPGWIAWYLVDKVGTPVEDVHDAIAEVDALADAGADGIKIVIDQIPLEAPTLSRDVARMIVAQAKTRGLRTVAHIGTTQDAIDAAEAGVALWVHGVYKERMSEAQIAELASYGIPMVTTSEVFDRYARSDEGPLIPTKLERETVPASVIESFYPSPDGFDVGTLGSWLDIMKTTRQARRDNVRRLHEAGVTILAGSDVQSGVFPGASLHR
ncbi:MAG: imidazolonepropionase-like amidohydrolase, partial [Myxococcota bacterium]